MGTPVHLDQLEVVGYANVFGSKMLPSVAPPVFRLKADADRAFVPPYSLNAGFLCNATEVTHAELEELRDAEEITLFDAAFPARADYELWVDQSFQWHYEQRGEAERKLRDIADRAIKDAEEAFAGGDFEAAEHLSGVAISADDRRVEPLAIKAAIRRLQGNPAGERLMAELGAPALKDKFEVLVADYCASRWQSPPTALECRRRPPRIKGVALCHAAA